MDRDQRQLGWPVDFPGARIAQRAALEGRYARLAPLDPGIHGEDLWRAVREPGADLTWDYLPYGPFAGRGAFDAHLARFAKSDDPLAFAILGRDDGVARGMVALVAILADMGTIEIGHVWFAPSLAGTRVASEAIFLLMREAFDGLGNRRLEWKTNALNVRSRRAAERFGFVYEGLFRQHKVWKGRNRDTVWYSVIDAEWPRVRGAFESWLDPANFDAEGRQKTPLDASQASGPDACE